VFILCDNVGWGDFSCYGGSIPTPRIDKLASEGIRFNNYTIESQCTPTRTALMTGRQSVRCGTYTVVPGQGKNGLTPWEYTIAELLSDAGYATSLYGKWHLGDTEGRLPNNQGFDEWWGYRNTADECGFTTYALFNAVAKARGLDTPKIWEGKKGQKSTAVRELNMEVRPLLDELIVDKANDFITRAAKGDKPFLHLCRSLPCASPREGAPGLRPDRSDAPGNVRRPDCRDGPPSRTNRRLRRARRDRGQHNHCILQRQRRSLRSFWRVPSTVSALRCRSTLWDQARRSSLR
jgi:hypothetical protein